MSPSPSLQKTTLADSNIGPFDRDSTLNDEEIIDTLRGTENMDTVCLMIAAAIDRVAFVSYILLFAISAIVYF